MTGRDLLIFQMADSLVRSGVALDSDQAVIAHLLKDHGVYAVTNALDDAIEAARQMQAETNRAGNCAHEGANHV